MRIETLRGEGRAAFRRARRSPEDSADGGRDAARGGRARVGFGRPVGTVRERRRRRAVVGVDGGGCGTGGVAGVAHRGLECLRARRRRHRRPPAPCIARLASATSATSSTANSGSPRGSRRFGVPRPGIAPRRGFSRPRRSPSCDGDLAGDAVLVHARRPPGFAVVDAARRVGRGPRRGCRARLAGPAPLERMVERVSPRSANRVPAPASRSSSRSPSAGRSRATG